MPPQRDANEIGDEQQSVPANKVDDMDDADGEAAPAAGGSYWDAPKEKALMNTSVSMLDMTTLEANHPDEKKEKTTDYWEAPQEKCLKGKTLSTIALSSLADPEDDATTPSSPKKVSLAAAISVEPAAAAPSYWDAPKEDALKNKTLSSLDMTLLEANHPDEQKEKKDGYWEAPTEGTLEGKTLSELDMKMLEANNPAEKQEKKDSYWEAQPEKTLMNTSVSMLDMTSLEANHPEEKKEKKDSYWEAPEEEELKGKTLSTIDMATLESTGISTDDATEQPTSGGASYWDDAPIDKSLKGKTISALDMTTMDKQHLDEPASHGQAAPYWDWKLKAIRRTLSQISISNLRKGSTSDSVLDDDAVYGGNNGGDSSGEGPPIGEIDTNVKPITKKVHRLRDSWRKSFHKMSTNTLSQLDESTGSGSRTPFVSRLFKSKNSLDISGGSRGSQGSIDEDAIMF